MTDLIYDLPSPIARPFLLATEKGPQRKELQRFCLENLVSFLAAISVSDVLDHYHELRESESPAHDAIAKLQGHDRLTGMDLDQMALGKWVGLLRETTLVAQGLREFAKVPELIDFYHGSSSKKVVSLINELVTLRNNDAHGSPIPHEKLEAELDKREIMLRDVIESCAFLSDYRLVVLDSFDIEGGQAFYSGRAFLGAQTRAARIVSRSSIPQGEPILYNQKTSSITRLTPLVVYRPLDGEDDPQISIFSKVLDRNHWKMRYIALAGHCDIDLDHEDEQKVSDLVRRRKLLLEIYSSPEVFVPAVQSELNLVQEVIDVREVSELTLRIDNPKKSVDVFDLAVRLALPPQFTSVECLDKGNAEVTSLTEAGSPHETQNVRVTHLAAGDSQKIQFSFQTREQGTLDIPPAILSYKYYRTDSDRENDKLSDGEVSIDKVTVESRDPKSLDPMTPVLNVSRRYVPIESQTNERFQIGEPFAFEISVENVGLGAARNASLELIFPPEIEVIDGIVELDFSLNPTETRTFRYTLRTHIGGVYAVKVRNITYSDARGVRYATRCDDDFRVLILSDVEACFRFQVEEITKDLYISEDEKYVLEGMRRELSRSGLDEARIELLEKKARTESTLRVLRGLVRETCERRNQKIHESIFEETGHQTGKDHARRTSVVFSASGFPFFAIDVSENESEPLTLHSIDEVGPVDDACAEDVRPLYVTPFKDDRTLARCVRLETLLSAENLGRGYIKGWVNRCLGFVDRQLMPWKKLADAVEPLIDEEFAFRKGMFQPRATSPTIRDELGISEQDGFGIIRDPRSSKNPNFLFFLNLDSNEKRRRDFLAKERKNFPELTFLSFRPSKDGPEEQKLLDTWYESGRESTKIPAVRLTIRSEGDLEKGLELIRKLVDLVRHCQAIEILASADFCEQRGIDALRDAVEPLLRAGVGLRRSVWQDTGGSKPCIELYPYRAFPIGGSETRNCVGFLNANNKNWDLWLNFYGEINSDAPIFEHLSVHPRWDIHVTKNNRWLYASKAGEDESLLDYFISAVIEVGKDYREARLAIWPRPKMREMLIEYGRKNVAFFRLLKLLADEPAPWNSVLEELEKDGMDKQGERLLRQVRVYPSKYGWETPLVEHSDGQDRILGISERFRETVEEMLEENPDLEFSDAADTGPINLALSQIKKVSPLLENKTATNQRVQYKGSKLRVGNHDTVLALSVNKKTVNCSVQVEDYGDAESVVREALEALRTSLSVLSDRAHIGPVRTSGRNDQHLRLDVDVDHADFVRLEEEDAFVEVKDVAGEFCQLATKASAP